MDLIFYTSMLLNKIVSYRKNINKGSIWFRYNILAQCACKLTCKNRLDTVSCYAAGQIIFFIKNNIQVINMFFFKIYDSFYRSD
jgi:hypothetical protein